MKWKARWKHKCCSVQAAVTSLAGKPIQGEEPADRLSPMEQQQSFLVDLILLCQNSVYSGRNACLLEIKTHDKPAEFIDMARDTH